MFVFLEENLELWEVFNSSWVVNGFPQVTGFKLK